MDENGLYVFHQALVEHMKGSGAAFNWHCDLDIPAIDLDRVRMVGVSDEAAEWRQKEPACNMYFSHGEYYGDGIQHIIKELKIKPTSNRALYSLLAQEDISGSDDDPIPSFLTFQCSIEGDVLYCTASFRALEVGNFLQVNLEEIRQNLVEICKAFQSVETIHLHIFAFHAYVRDTASAALRRPAIDVKPERELMRLMQKGDVNLLDQLLEGFERSTTVVSPKSLALLCDILSMPDAGLHDCIQSKQVLLTSQLTKTIEACEALTASRKGASRGINTDARIKEFQASVKKLRDTLLS